MQRSKNAVMLDSSALTALLAEAANLTSQGTTMQGLSAAQRAVATSGDGAVAAATSARDSIIASAYKIAELAGFNPQ